ncbi:uncharacterized protein (DUF849 family) [Rhodoligotrophos appendicifer]|uniref:3-keto-5-aminohexanoate cleavage protein n=1 Tax=Rhodoligotrophos appendicifer TaxID=987056 RepID=UPI001186C6AE|nr:3-keto-5-aminohexanoate cleavage protein [Rhodoligotrophos appendicifer]
MSRPVIITCALTGDSDTTKKSPHVPVTPAQIAEDALKAARAGAAIVHIHVRDPETTRGSRDIALYREAVEQIRASGTEIIINLTAGMGGKLVLGAPDCQPFDPVTDLVGGLERMAHVEALRPEICSLDCGSFNNGAPTELYVSTPEMIRGMATRMQEIGVKPELEIFDLGHLRLALNLVADGLISPPPFFQFALGLRWGAGSDLRTLLLMHDMLPPGSVWAAFGAGAEQMPMAAQSVLMGGHVRVGLEDNLFRSRGVLASNEDLVTDAVHLVKALGAVPATVAEARELLGLCDDR